jgi:predicted O-methyltransferase YrrM
VKDDSVFKTLDQLKQHHVGAMLRLRPARGAHTSAEREALIRHATDRRAAVEIGVLEGVSAAVIRSVMRPGGTLWLIDPYRRRHGISAARSVARRTVAKGGGSIQVYWIRALSTDVGPSWSESLDFVFIDGDHSEVVCEEDWRNFSPHVVTGGQVAFHDSRVHNSGHANHGSGPVRVCNRHFRDPLTRDAAWRIVEEVDSLTIVERC